VRARGTLDGNNVCRPDLARPSLRGRPRAVVDPEGRLWPSIAAASRAYRLTRSGILYRIGNTATGWRYAGDGR
jgi:hypothetical protein